MLVTEFMTKVEQVVTVFPETTIFETARRLASHRISVAVVVTQQNGLLFPLGIVSNQDIVRHCVAADEPITREEIVSRIMSKGVATVDLHQNRDDAAELMADFNVHHLVVVQGAQKTLAGLVSSWDIAREVTLDRRAWPYNRSAFLAN
jgi:CBS domain-containing protein